MNGIHPKRTQSSHSLGVQAWWQCIFAGTTYLCSLCWSVALILLVSSLGFILREDAIPNASESSFQPYFESDASFNAVGGSFVSGTCSLTACSAAAVGVDGMGLAPGTRALHDRVGTRAGAITHAEAVNLLESTGSCSPPKSPSSRTLVRTRNDPLGYNRSPAGARGAVSITGYWENNDESISSPVREKGNRRGREVYQGGSLQLVGFGCPVRGPNG